MSAPAPTPPDPRIHPRPGRAARARVVVRGRAQQPGGSEPAAHRAGARADAAAASRREVPLNVRTWVAATGGDFELRVARPDYDSPVGIVQVDSVTRGGPPRPSGRRSRRLVRASPTSSRSRSRTRSARKSRSGSFTFCPNSLEHQRVDDSGPGGPALPDVLRLLLALHEGDGLGHRRRLGRRGRSVSGDFGTPRIRVPRAGEFTLTVRIAERYRDLLEISDSDGEVSFPVTIKNVRRPPGIPVPCERAARAVRAPPSRTSPTPIPARCPISSPFRSGAWRRSTARTKDFLAFAATPWNAGPAPLVVEGFRRPGEEVMDAFQYFRDEDGNVVGRAPVGEMRFHAHPAHNHWHFLQFALFTLRDAADKELVRSRKQAYCLAPTDAIDLTVERASWGRGRDLFTACGDRERALGARGAPDRLGRHVLPVHAGAVVQHHESPQRLVLRPDSGQPAREPLRDGPVEQRRDPLALPRRPPGRATGPRHAVARDRGVTAG